MKNTRKGKVITIFILLLVFVSFLVPDMFLRIQEKQLEEMVFAKEEKESKLDVEAEKIYLVKAIHEIEENSNDISIKQSEIVYTSKGEKEDFALMELGKQIEKLEDMQILKEVGIDSPTRHTIFSSVVGYQNQKMQYFLDNIQLEIEKTKYELVVESKTGKIISIACPKEKLWEERTKEEILRSFIQYLDLYIIDDWKYEEGMLQIEGNRNHKKQMIARN